MSRLSKNRSLIRIPSALVVGTMLGTCGLAGVVSAQPAGKQPTTLRMQNAGKRIALSPEYLKATSKFRTNIAQSKILTNGNSVLSISLLRGGDDRAVSNTTESRGVPEGGYTCVTRNVDEQLDFRHLPMFSNISDNVYPGALFLATDVINDRYTPFIIPSGTARQPYQLTVNLFNATGASLSETIHDYTLAGFRNGLQKILQRSVTSNPPVDVRVEYIEAKTKEEVGLKLGYNFKANVPPELTMLVAGVPVGVNASVSASASASQTKSKSRILMRVNYTYFSANISAPADQMPDLFSPRPGSNIDNNLACVTSMAFGSTGYVYFESDQTQEELQTTLNETVGVNGGDLGGNASVSESVDAKRKFESANIKWIAAGHGFSVSPGQVVQATSFDQLKSLFGRLHSWSPTNMGAPIAYTMNFVKDNAEAIVSYKTGFVNKECTQAAAGDLKYDVDIELKRIDVKKVGDLDGTEDLYGKIEFKKLKAGSSNKVLNGHDKTLWSKTHDGAIHQRAGSSVPGPGEQVNLVKNISLAELRSLELSVGGAILDEEGIMASRPFICDNCGTREKAMGFENLDGTRVVRFVEESKTLQSIDALANNGSYQKLKFGDDTLLTLNFFESGNKNDGRTEVHFVVWVKPHQ